MIDSFNFPEFLVFYLSLLTPIFSGAVISMVLFSPFSALLLLLLLGSKSSVADSDSGWYISKSNQSCNQYCSSQSLPSCHLPSLKALSTVQSFERVRTHLDILANSCDDYDYSIHEYYARIGPGFDTSRPVCLPASRQTTCDIADPLSFRICCCSLTGCEARLQYALPWFSYESKNNSINSNVSELLSSPIAFWPFDEYGVDYEVGFPSYKCLSYLSSFIRVQFLTPFYCSLQ